MQEIELTKSSLFWCRRRKFACLGAEERRAHFPGVDEMMDEKEGLSADKRGHSVVVIEKLQDTELLEEDKQALISFRYDDVYD